MSADPTLQRLASGVLWPGFLGTRAPDWLRRGLDDGLPGAVLFGHNVDPEDPDGTSRLAASIRTGGDALLLGIDEEGGNVTRLEAATGSSFPGAAQLGRIGDPGLTRSVATALGDRVRRSGATMVLGPVADVNSNPRNPVIGVRSFGSDPEAVSRHTAAAVEGLRAGGVLSCVKHFPGHGDTIADSHVDAPRVQLGRERMDAIHLPPFLAAIEAGVDAVMTAHVIFPEFGEAPATVNPAVLGRLRELGFTGLIVSDALDMAAISQTMGVGPGAVASLAAGADLLCLGNPAPVYRRSAGDDEHDFTSTRDAIVEALRSGALPVERLEEAGERIARARREADRVARAERDAGIAPLDDRELIAIADRAIESEGIPSSGPGEPRLLLDIRRAAHGAIAARNEPFSVELGAERLPIDPADGPSEADLARIGAHPGPVLVLCDALPSADAQRRFIADVRAIRADAIVLDAGTPGDIPAPVIRTRGSNRAVARALAARLDPEQAEPGTAAGERTFLAVDLGKTSCRVQLRRGARVLAEARGTGAPGLGETDGVERAFAAITAAVASLPTLPVYEDADPVPAAIGVGAAGAESAPEAAQRLARLLGERFGGSAAVISDAYAAHAGAFAGRPGTVIIAGTGACGIVLDPGGELRRIDGWGPWLGDAGSGQWLGRRGLEAALRDFDGRGPCTMLRGIAESMIGGPLDGLPAWLAAGEAPAARLGGFAPEVLRAAEHGDAVADAILAEGIAHLAELARAGAAVETSAVGGITEHPLVEFRLARAIEAVGSRPVPAAGTALDGIALIAMRTDLAYERKVRRHG
ncbi:glycoside hydrolase family 3 N-terminal domain-containing protein [Leucobacter iarius]|uniref:Beta-N-acetylhexosaminidase n=1 Tax=Leucobacter iarius TaxID=333963 RepID=A0ABP4XYB9_9MICO